MAGRVVLDTDNRVALVCHNSGSSLILQLPVYLFLGGVAMNIKRTILSLLVVVTISLLWAFQVGAYSLFTSDPPDAGRCSQCHTDWPGATHTVHTAFSCSNCHIDDDPVAPSACSGCHPAADVLTAHGGVEAPGDARYCGYCHAGVSAENRTLDELKALYQ